MKSTSGPAHKRLGRQVLASLLAASVLSGCAYSLGPTNGQVAGGKSIQINPLVNQALEPRLTEAVTTSIRKNIQRDGTFKLDTKNESDVVLNGTILRYDRTEVSFQPRDVITPRDYRVSIVARIIARERAGGKVLVDREVTGYTTVRVGPDLSSAERQAVPLIADDLARRVVSLLAEGVW
jgi:hypothetical protein